MKWPKVVNFLSYKYFSRYLDEKKIKLILAVIIQAFQSLLFIPTVLLIKHSFDHIISGNHPMLLISFGTVLIILQIANTLLAIALRTTHIDISTRAIYNLRLDFIQKIYACPSPSINIPDHNEILEAMIIDTERLSNNYSLLFSNMFPSILSGMILSAILVYIDCKLFLSVLLLSIVPFLILKNQSLAVERSVKNFQTIFGDYMKSLYQIMKNLKLTIIQSAQEQENSKQREIFNKLRLASIDISHTHSLLSHFQNFVASSFAVFALVLGGLHVYAGRISSSELASFYVASLYLFRHIYTVTSSLPDLYTFNESLDKIFDLYNRILPESQRGDLSLDTFESIQLKDLSFSYSSEKPLLNCVNLTVNKGKTVAIIGDNGSGKTTLLNLICGLLKPQSGTVLINDKPLLDYDIIRLRKKMGIVMQKCPAISANIRENIAYGEAGYKPEMIKDATKITLAHDWISNLQQDYDTLIGEAGIELSSGECQRIAIARSIFRRPELMIFDEPSVHLSPDVAKEILISIRKFNPEQTVIIASHDPIIIGLADEIYRIDGLKLEKI